MTAAAAARRKREGDQIASDLLRLVWRLHAHVRGESPIYPPAPSETENQQP